MLVPVSDRLARRDRVRESLEAFRTSNPGQSNLNAVLADMVLREKFVPLACADDFERTIDSFVDVFVLSGHAEERWKRC